MPPKAWIDGATPLVSVIIPCHNRLGPLRECLESVEEQTYRDLEVIVVDDDSDEDVKAVVGSISWSSSRSVRYTRTPSNLGPGGAREIGRQMASGDFICYLDSDDLWHPRKVAAQVQCLQSAPEAGMCYCTSSIFERLPLTGEEPVRHWSDREVTAFLPKVLHWRPWGTAACMWTREATDRVGPWFASWAWEDHEYDCRAGCLDIGVAFVPEVLCHHRRGESEERLSAAHSYAIPHQRALALLQMAETLIRTGKARDRLIRDPLVDLLYGASLSLYSTGETALGGSCLGKAREVSSVRSRAGLAVRVLLGAQRALPPHLTARLGRRLRPSIRPTSPR